MKLRILAIAAIAALVLLLMGCESVNEQMAVEECNSISATIQYYTDPETRVCYLIYNAGYAGGITVRYNANGSIMVK